VTSNLELRRRRLLAIALLMAVVASTLAVAVMPLWASHRTAREAQGALEARLERLRERGSMRAALERRYAEMNQRYDSDPRFLKSKTESLAEAELQGVLKRVVEQFGGSIQSAQVLPVQRDGNLTRLALKVTVRIALEALVSTLYSLENETPYVFVDGLSIRAARSYRSGPVEPGTEAKELTVEVQLYSYLRSGSP
jgi:hypothetical protein